jgi:PTH1 family peptidyl-tRNA hydrolase
VTTDRHCVIIGLGNPGKKYALTRHNLGYLVVQVFGEEQGWSFQEKRAFKAFVAKGQIGDAIVHLLLPTTYMNESGQAARLYLDYYQLDQGAVCVVLDDIHLSFGDIRVRQTGSPGGHNGLKSIQAHLGTQDYVRLRLGIGRGLEEKPLADYVLDDFTAEEKAVLPKVLRKGTEILKRLICEDLAAVMNAVNIKQKRQINEELLGETNNV